jgi:RecB family endonuclease NucS
MADIQLFKISGQVQEIHGSGVTLEKELQTIIEDNMQAFFGVTFLATEYATNNGGRMDSIGIDENNCPVIFEYKHAE